MPERNPLDKYRRRVNQIRRQHPKMSYESAREQASREFKRGHVSGRKSKPKSKEKARRVGAKYRVYHEVKKIGSVSDTERAYREQLKQKLAWELLAKESAQNVKDRKKAAAAIAETKKKLHAVGGLRRG